MDLLQNLKNSTQASEEDSILSGLVDYFKNQEGFYKDQVPAEMQPQAPSATGSWGDEGSSGGWDIPFVKDLKAAVPERPQTEPQTDILPQPDLDLPQITQPKLGEQLAGQDMGLIGQEPEPAGDEQNQLLLGLIKQLTPKPKSKWDRISDTIRGVGSTMSDVGAGLSGQQGTAIDQYMKTKNSVNPNIWKLLQYQQLMQGLKDKKARRKEDVNYRTSKQKETERHNKAMEGKTSRGSQRDYMTEAAFREELKKVPSIEDIKSDTGFAGFWQDSDQEAIDTRSKMIEAIRRRYNGESTASGKKKSLSEFDG